MNPKKWWKETEKERIYRHLKTMDPSSEEYKKLLDVYEQMCEIERADHVSKDALAQIGGNLLVVLAVLKFEELNVISTKALNFIIRGRP